MRPIALRLKPGQDLKAEIENWVRNEHVEAGCLISAVGSLNEATIRLADGKTVKTLKGPFEIVSMTGTVSMEGCHLHLSFADTDGNVFGGHLQIGCPVNTTVELVISVFDEIRFGREFDPDTGYEELSISSIG
jgi:hypothetical protein